ncbi:MAG TPA: insulinase family protein, partial [Longimicrobiales bacterium]|nr:insulinase family protein [Longimicrobiales bacterium]
MLPPFQDRALPGGARLLVVTQHEMPFVTVNLVLPAGRTRDPAGRVGLAELTAGLLTRGTTSRSAGEIADALHFLGAELRAEASQDWATVSASAVTSDLP